MLTTTNWAQVLNNTREHYKKRGESNYHRMALEDITERMARDERITPLQAKEHLNSLLPRVIKA